jgi:DNA-binding MarR family transcriptional regulator
MEAEKICGEQTAERIAENIFYALPLLKKRMMCLESVQADRGIPISHIQVLAMLEEVGSMTVSEISRKFGMAKPNITPLVDRLIQHGLVDRVHSDSDRRVVNVVILDEGRRKVAEIRGELLKDVCGWASRLDEADYGELARSLDNVVKILARL